MGTSDIVLTARQRNPSRASILDCVILGLPFGPMKATPPKRTPSSAFVPVIAGFELPVLSSRICINLPLE